MDQKLVKGSGILSVAEAIDLMFVFGGFLITYTIFILSIIDRKKDDEK